MPSLSSFTVSPHKMCSVASRSRAEAQRDSGDFWSACSSVFNFDSLSGIGLPLKAAAAEKNDRVKMRSLLTRCGRWAIHFGRGMTRHLAMAAAVRPKFNALSSLHFLCPLSIIRRSAAFFCNDSSLDTARCPNALLARRSRTTRTDRRDDGPAFLQDGRARNGTRPRKLSFLIPLNGALVTDSLM